MRARDYVALVLAVAAGTSVVALTLAALWDALSDPENSGLSTAYTSLLTGTLGVMIGALAGYIGGRHDPSEESGPPDPPDSRRRRPAGSKTEGGQQVSPSENDSQTDRRAEQ